MGYTAWAAGGFSPTDYNLTMTPLGSAGNFTDQQTVSQCVVGTRDGTFNSFTANNFSGVSGSSGAFGGSSGTVAIAGSTKLAAEGAVSTLMAMIALITIVLV